jgi:hypothetical protein
MHLYPWAPRRSVEESFVGVVSQEAASWRRETKK